MPAISKIFQILDRSIDVEEEMQRARVCGEVPLILACSCLDLDCHE